MGSTVDEPDIVIEPDTLPVAPGLSLDPPPSSLLHAALTNASASMATRMLPSLRSFTIVPSSASAYAAEPRQTGWTDHCAKMNGR
jgi:hypothetical protein